MFSSHARPGTSRSLTGSERPRRQDAGGSGDEEPLTKPVYLVEADESASEGYEGFVDVGAPLVADGEASETVEPSERSLHMR